MQDNYGNSLPIEELLSRRPEEVSFTSTATVFASRDVGPEDRPAGLGKAGDTAPTGLHAVLLAPPKPLAEMDEPVCPWCLDTFEARDTRYTNSEGVLYHQECWDDILSGEGGDYDYED